MTRTLPEKKKKPAQRHERARILALAALDGVPPPAPGHGPVLLGLALLGIFVQGLVKAWRALPASSVPRGPAEWVQVAMVLSVESCLLAAARAWSAAVFCMEHYLISLGGVLLVVTILWARK